MPKKYHIHTTPVPPRLPRVGKFGVVDWREDCARCHNCVKKACVYDRHREELAYIKNLENVDTLFFHCMGCFSCVQNCTKNLLCLTINSEYQTMGNHYWTPDIIQSTWLQAETASVPVSGAGYRGRFAGAGFDSMWTDMSEIVRPTRDGIHGREYISTSVDIGKKPSFLDFEKESVLHMPSIIDIPLPMIIDMNPPDFTLPQIKHMIIEAAWLTDLIVVIDSAQWPVSGNKGLDEDPDRYLNHIAFFLNPDAPPIPDDQLRKTRMAEIPDGEDPMAEINRIKEINPGIVVSVRVALDAAGVRRALDLAGMGVEAVHVTADVNGNEIGVENPRHLRDLIREIHTALVKDGRRDEVTLIAGGGIALAEHMAKAVICGADLVSTHLPLMISLECRVCGTCRPGITCPARFEEIDFEYGSKRMRNLIAAWHLQLIEVMGAMGMRDARRLRGDVGRAMFFEELEEEIFGSIFGTRRTA